MNPNQKANLQRKLTLAPVPKPPAGLAERIKSEIPKHLRFDAEQERERLSHSVAFNIRVAASILILVSCAYLALQFMTRIEQEKPATIAVVAKRSAGVSPAVPPAAGPAAYQPASGRRSDKVAKRQRAKKVETIAAAPASAPPVAREEAKVRTAALSSVSIIEPEMTTSPISGKVVVWSPSDGQIDGARRVDQANVYELEPNAATIHLDDRRLKLIAWKDVSRQAKAAILSAELARGGDPQAIARVAREAGLNDLADSIEKQR
jgi:hypothetical protein